jgi:hypothetical protein
LKDLDPQGAIQKFLEGGDRPDISNIINRKSKPKGKKAAPAGDKSPKKKSAPQAPAPQSFNDDDDEDIAAASEDIPKKSPQKAKESSSEETYLVMLGELYDGLEGVLSDDSRADVVEYLKQRIESIADPTKKATTVRKIAEKLGDDDYWVEYAAKLE